MKGPRFVLIARADWTIVDFIVEEKAAPAICWALTQSDRFDNDNPGNPPYVSVSDPGTLRQTLAARKNRK